MEPKMNIETDICQNEDSNDGADRIDKDYFISILEKHGTAMLNDARSVATAKEREAALTMISNTIFEEKGTRLSNKKITNKFRNIKTRAKQKSDDIRSGKKRLSLTEAEERLLVLCGLTLNEVTREYAIEFICISLRDPVYQDSV